MKVSYTTENDLALIQMDDGKKNAITKEAAEQIVTCIDKAESEAKAIVIAGRPGAFCAGYDLAIMTSGDKKAINALSKAGSQVLYRLYSTPMPVVAACTGHAFTIGAIWLAGCDTRIGEEGDYKFGMTETAMGVALPPYGMEPLKARLDPTKFIKVVTQSWTFGPQEACEVGFLDEVVSPGASMEVAMSTASELAKLPQPAYADNKLTVRKESLAIIKADVEGS